MVGVAVRVLGSGVGSAVTDSSGEFVLPVKPGYYMVRLERDGYGRQNIGVTVPDTPTTTHVLLSAQHQLWRAASSAATRGHAALWCSLTVNAQVAEPLAAVFAVLRVRGRDTLNVLATAATSDRKLATDRCG